MDHKNDFALVLFYPLTGRKHQIRIHSKAIECPILGDDKHNFRATKKQNLHLHSLRLSLDLEGKKICSYAEIPDYFLSTAKKLGFSLPQKRTCKP